MKNTYYSNGKLLLTGEYVVLDGAMALAIPTKYGQSLEIESSDKPGIHWKSLDEENKIWFEDTFELNSLEGEKSQNPISKTLSSILIEARKLNPNFLSDEIGYKIITKLDFPRNWGLGTSSTLINNIAQWSKTDGFLLLKNSFGGSGDDIAASQNNSPIFFKIKNDQPEIKQTSLDWDFKESVFFVHLNEKQDSKQGIAHYKKIIADKLPIKRISEISLELSKCKTLGDFVALIEEHERIISETIKMPTIKEKLFKDYPGALKSLGAWGGDFVLATGNSRNMVYFEEKGFKTIISFSKMATLNP